MGAGEEISSQIRHLIATSPAGNEVYTKMLIGLDYLVCDLRLSHYTL